jgi:hypothetical protein
VGEAMSLRPNTICSYINLAIQDGFLICLSKGSHKSRRASKFRLGRALLRIQLTTIMGPLHMTIQDNRRNRGDIKSRRLAPTDSLPPSSKKQRP